MPNSFRTYLSHKVGFRAALILLLASGAALGWLLYRTFTSEQWVRHTYRVELLLSDIMFEVNKTGRDRQTYLDSGDTQVLQQMEQAHVSVRRKLDHLRQMVEDNSDQTKSAEELEHAIEGRFVTFEESLNLFQSGKSTPEAQNRYTQDLIEWSRRTMAITRTMQAEESQLLEQRTLKTRSIFAWTVFIAAFMYLFSLYVLWGHYRRLTRELKQRQLAEQKALKLSGQLLSAQDQERRKIARDLHDGLGQLLVAAKMAADSLLSRPDRQKMLELSGLLADAVSSTRSISHLLHPPLVDELGFVAAARSYIDGFSKRTMIEVRFDAPELRERLPRDLELVFFRILQEALSNIQRHSQSKEAEVRFHVNAQSATLEICDFGIGLPGPLVDELELKSGVGLMGMKERVREHHGRLEIHSNSNGTTISATVPLAPRRVATEQPAPEEVGP